ncbi:mismatch repair ATPase MLH1 KNAG_0I00790 [Huiozyma naganishii CBS 8797]|uniref:DNA mismatch repair protein S5 domain-containing protein n=1 Tax=Huiozyma naganishii (strain ATCC MYA-139 / BCRC 22969 / CBS 8797 / KCTC 17520 / NBRC 10181 / NCYC 3082 / Yp74L-3) TaxID=1071383 RepID=J7RAH2_HUIN7|nr:hypothetical protein KNAG_0I00790 [Kazachstania naganishii CBS 8797]CCK71870.1 hypothetical protein KNAG_0I00790 [Kazachstania naganishii CBS 8797]
MSGRIRALDAQVVNKIAAGEIIVSPVNAVKELLENCVDAGATQVDLLLRDGGIKLLQITDNGCGIEKADLPLLCERFTTSKLGKFEDLESIATYGFRGEALASISHIARVTVTTKTVSDRCAWRSEYTDGEMRDEPAPVAGQDGTTILVEDLFYNVPSRLRALRGPSDEFNKILTVVGKYAIHLNNVGFSCKKFGNAQFSLTVRNQLSMRERIRTIYGSNVATNLIDFEMDGDDELSLIHVEGQVSNLNYASKKSTTQPIFFINNRLVTCDPLRRSLQQVFTNYLPKGNKPFIYLSLLIKPEVVDVNIHPTKREVRFLKQDEIIAKISLHLSEILKKIDTSRSFKTSTILTGNQPIGFLSQTTSSQLLQDMSSRDQNQQHQAGPIKKPKRYEHNMVRTDASQTKITSFLRSSQYVPSQSTRLTQRQEEGDGIKTSANAVDRESTDAITNSRMDKTVQNVETVTDTPHGEDMNNGTADSPPVTVLSHSSNSGYTISKKERISVNLTSIKELREEVDASTHRELTNIFANLTYVGIVDSQRRLAAIQHDLKLFLIDYGAVSYELFYEIGLTDFANFGSIKLNARDHSEDLKLSNILNSNFPDVDLAMKKGIIKKIWDMKDMLEEYFSITIVPEVGTTDDNDSMNDVSITALPLLLKGYIPPLSKLPYFIYRLGTKINWDDEKECLGGILKQIALLYIPEMIEDNTSEQPGEGTVDIEKQNNVQKINELSHILEHVLFPCIKRRFLAPRQLLKDVVEIANLPGLYKVFERC